MDPWVQGPGPGRGDEAPRGRQGHGRGEEECRPAQTGVRHRLPEPQGEPASPHARRRGGAEQGRRGGRTGEGGHRHRQGDRLRRQPGPEGGGDLGRRRRGRPLPLGPQPAEPRREVLPGAGRLRRAPHHPQLGLADAVQGGGGYRPDPRARQLRRRLRRRGGRLDDESRRDDGAIRRTALREAQPPQEDEEVAVGRDDEVQASQSVCVRPVRLWSPDEYGS
mmetsp:Transcript_16302/g.40171  ORF Transcript_16302/g.40171 Transcript_16302/m.40171 type:complete len:221 (-) Transcript_16302:1761-2423(-)